MGHFYTASQGRGVVKVGFPIPDLLGLIAFGETVSQERSHKDTIIEPFHVLSVIVLC